MDLQLTGKLALVTGSTAGIGLAIGSTLAGEGATVIINGRTNTRVAEAIENKLFPTPQGLASAMQVNQGGEYHATSN